MEIPDDKILKTYKYETHPIFENENFLKLVSGVHMAECMKSEASSVENNVLFSKRITGYNEESLQVAAMRELSVSDSLTCSYCCTTFQNHVDQRNHYKLDWHRHNLKLSLRGMKPINEEEFSKLADDVSSISGSESDSSEEFSYLTDKYSREEEDGTQSTEHKQLIRHPKVFFVNKEGKMLSLYRCILHGKEDLPGSHEELFNLVQTIPSQSIWAIMMLGGGHFAAAVFHGNSAILHKTFHSYTVRAKQGGAQGSRDNKSATSHPRSAGASLRRYNEASFQQHIQDILEVWSPEISKCHLIFLRAVSHNRTLIFTGKNSLIKKNDPRIRSIPFPTRRATFSEVKRVHSILCSLEVYGSAESFLAAFPTTPRKPPRESQTSTQSESMQEKSSSSSSPEKASHQPKKKIDRGKARQSPCRPLPEKVEQLAMSSDDSSSESDNLLVESLEEMDFTASLQEYGDDVPLEFKNKIQKKISRRPRKKKKEKEILTLGAEVEAWRIKLHLACEQQDASVLASSLLDHESMTEEEVSMVLNMSVDNEGNTLLHSVSAACKPDLVRLLLEAGVNPAKKNKKGQTPYTASQDRETRITFRRFQAEYPDKYNYKKAQIPGPLTKEMEQEQADKQAERRRALRKHKKEKDAEKKKVDQERKRIEEVKKKEREERERFLKLSDREKCALAAERRALASGGTVESRCFLCGSHMTGKIPFTYQNFRFCSMECLKAHRFQSNNSGGL